jgi:hypothetical protein
VVRATRSACPFAELTTAPARNCRFAAERYIQRLHQLTAAQQVYIHTQWCTAQEDLTIAPQFRILMCAG